MTNIPHTPEPWVVWFLANDPATYGDDAGKPIITTADGECEITGVIPIEADAHRIVAAVNACKGLSTDELASGLIPRLFAALADLLGDRPDVQGGECRRCGREYHDIADGDCPSDDCPSYRVRALLRTRCDASVAAANPESPTPRARKESPMTSDDYFRGPSGARYTYAEIADRIRKEAPQTLGWHISVQLEAIGLYDEMRNGTTPYGLPYTFAEAPRLVEKRLTSNGMFYTPGFFRALQNDYRIKGEPRRRAVRILSEGYGLPREEAEGLLSGAIAIAIDEAAGTIAYTVAAQPESSAR